jgi:GT2 family glycosyltransferase
VPILLFTTRDGISSLPRTLEHLARLRQPEGLRIVAVDNGSSDGSGELLRRWALRLPITVLECPHRGKNRAINHALDQLGPELARAELVVVSDDDILPREDWLVRLLAAARRQPLADVFGGVIEPAWPHRPPDWLMALEDSFPVLFATTTHTGGPCSSHDIYGPNMAVRGHIFAAGARFEPSIGPDGTRRYGMGSESELLRRLERAGHRSYFCADAIVGHQVEAGQLTPESVIARARRYGYGLAMMDAQVRGRLSLAGTALRRLFDRELKALAATLPFWASRRLRTRFHREVRRGYLEALLRAPALPAMPLLQPLAPAPIVHRPIRADASPPRTAAITAESAIVETDEAIDSGRV